MSNGGELIYEIRFMEPIEANLFQNNENYDSVMFKYVKSHFKQLLCKTLF